MEIEVNFYLVAAIVVVLTGISKSGFGASLEMLAVPVLSIFVLPLTAAAIMLPVLLMIDAANLWQYRRDWVRWLVFGLLPAATFGILFGTVLYRYMSPDWIRLGIGALALAFLAQMLWAPANGKTFRKPGRFARGVLAALGGFTSFVAHAGGPPVKMILLSEDLSKKQFVGTNSYLFAAINLIKLLPYFYLGQLSAQNLVVSFSLFPFVLLGVGLGFWLNGVVPQNWFYRVVVVGLFIAGVKLIYDGMTGIF